MGDASRPPPRPALRGPARRRWPDPLQFLLAGGLLLFLLLRGSDRMAYNWQWYRIPEFLFTVSEGGLVPGPLLRGLFITVQITAFSMVLALLFGLVTAVFRMSGSPLARLLARGYLEAVRNTPLLVQLFFIYFVLGPVLNLDRTTAAVLALSLFEGAYASEIFRAGIVSIFRGQWEAAFSLGLNKVLTYRLVIIPQALSRILPPLTGQAVSLVKDSALVSTIAVYDLTMQGRAIVSETFLVFEIWFTVAAIYLVMTGLVSFAANLMENRMKI